MGRGAWGVGCGVWGVGCGAMTRAEDPEDMLPQAVGMGVLPSVRMDPVLPQPSITLAQYGPSLIGILENGGDRS